MENKHVIYKFGKTNRMGEIHAEIELTNGYEVEMARRHFIGEEEIKRINISALVDTGSILLCINENIQEYMKFPVVDSRNAVLADGTRIKCDIVSGVDLRFKNRKTQCRAMILPGDSEPLLGAIPLEDLDVLIDPLRRELIVHPERPNLAMTKVKASAL